MADQGAHGHQHVLVTEEGHQEKPGFFSKFMKEVDVLGEGISNEFHECGQKLRDSASQNYSSKLLDLFQTNNIIQLISHASGKAVQFAEDANGQPGLDANGHLDPNAQNSQWTVLNEGKNQIRLAHGEYFLAIINGFGTLVHMKSGQPHNLETLFQLDQVHQQFVVLESQAERGYHIGFLSSGELKSAMVCETGQDSQFAVKLVSTAYPVFDTEEN